MEDFKPEEHTAAEVVEELEEATPVEVAKIVGAELAGKNRKTVLEAAGVEEGERRDSSGRVLNPWEVAPVPAK